MTLRGLFNMLCTQYKLSPTGLGIHLAGRLIIKDELFGQPLILTGITTRDRGGRGAVRFVTPRGAAKLYSWNPESSTHLLFADVKTLSCERVVSITGGKTKIVVSTGRENY